MTLSPTNRLRPGREVLTTQVGNELVLLDLASEQYYGLDAVGRTMWTRLTAARDVGEAVEALLADFDVDRETLERDVAALVSELVTRRLVDVADGPPG